MKTDNQTKCDSNVCEVGWEEGDEDEKKGNDEKMHCIGSLVMPPSANLVNARISHQQHSTAAVVRLRWWQYIENDGHADDFFLLSLKYKIGSPHQ